MPLQSTSGAASYDAFGGGVPAVPKYIEDYFSTYLVTGDGTAPAVNNGIDLSTKGGLVWIKRRSAAGSHNLFDTARGANLRLISNDTAAQDSKNLSFTTTGFSNYTFDSGVTEVSWSWAKAPKFFDVVTYTGTGSAQDIAHNLGSTVGCIIVKNLEELTNWAVYHRSLGGTYITRLNTTGASETGYENWANTDPTSTVFTVGNGGATNRSGKTYVAYLFAHNAGGFGLTGTDNVISCGSVTADGSGNATVNLGYEPQWILVKRSDGVNSWAIVDTMRGLPADGLDRFLFANNSNAESGGGLVNINATGFYANATLSASATYIYIAIRRGPMKVPTSGTSVFSTTVQTGVNNINGQFITTGFPPDLSIEAPTSSSGSRYAVDRLRGNNFFLTVNDITSEFNASPYGIYYNSSNVGVQNRDYGTLTNTYVDYLFRRAPSFFDEVCYTGTGSARTVTHNLTVAPELMIVKVRDSATDWAVYHSGIGATKRLILNLTDTPYTSATAGWNDTAPTASVFTVGTNVTVNGNGYLYVAYLFATCAGVSKVFSYTGNGSSQTINCGFTAGARWIMIKRTDSTGDWYVWDSARGIVSGNDPHLSLNSTAAEVTTDDTVDTDNTGFIVNQVAATNVNVSSATYIGIAIA